MARHWTDSFADAVADIRQKVVEEPMWGRSLGDNDAPHWPEPQEPQPSFGSATHTLDVGPTYDQMQENGNYRLAAMQRELNGGEWPQARESGPQQDREQDMGLDR